MVSCWQDVQYFNLEPPEFSLLQEVSADIATAKEKWSKYGDFVKERDELGKQDWLSVRDQVKTYFV